MYGQIVNTVFEMTGINTLKDNQIFQDDNCPIHRCKEAQACLEANCVAKKPWPAYSPDFSQIEYVWAYMERQLQAMKLTSDNLEETVFGFWFIFDNVYKS